MTKISKFGEDFLLLALRIDKHIKGYVDFYYGPEKLRQIVDNEPILSPSKLLINSDSLLYKLDSQGYDIKRERYIDKSLMSMKTSIELLNGKEISIEDQFLKFYDVVLQPANDSELESLKKDYEDAYDGSGSLEERLEKLRIRRRVPEEKVFEYFSKALKITEKNCLLIFYLIKSKLC